MFEKKRCKKCGDRLKDEWEFCPRCGKKVTDNEENMPRSFDVFANMNKEIEKMDKEFGFGMHKFKPPVSGGGISITIRSGPSGEPKIEVRTSDGFKRVNPENNRKLEVKPMTTERKFLKVAKFTEEPQTKVENLGSKQKIQIELPDVKSEKDIEIRKLDQSIEIKALAGDKAYFKLIPITSNSSIIGNEFKDGILRIEIKKGLVNA